VQCLDVFASADATRAVLRSAWDMAYQGGTADLLEGIAVSATLDPEFLTRPYTNQISIIQSSGTGKSRAVDELAKKLFTLPFNFREDLHAGESVT
jgi:hypothetical protein